MTLWVDSWTFTYPNNGLLTIFGQMVFLFNRPGTAFVTSTCTTTGQEAGRHEFGLKEIQYSRHVNGYAHWIASLDKHQQLDRRERASERASEK